ncbi:anthranilate phosphoribosyltransferase [Halococcoides cellulosivorans]|uniref:Anthranilate phosphoribosyltransferase n=1 Tax=Halococcoides cellulosivorans TaxID=1679096 RepID=A0A2R4X071_9EURY|nr:anthranilate phosphoribosyltransferase [Halococcoides cellulosivorans]AWB27173.1 anthranilate phosphoribosyltransferase [Halococcoides cellulosivorans]
MPESVSTASGPTLRELMTNVVGSGPKTADDMTADQARTAMDRILDREPDPTTLGAFLLANRWKTNTPTELAATLDVTRERGVETATPSVDPVDCGANYDGKAETAIFGVAAGLTAAAAGQPVVVHSGSGIPTQEAPAYYDVLDELGVATDLEPPESAAMTDDVGFGFYFQPNFAPEIDALYDRRAAMGVRTFINTIETLVNPANADVHLGSFYHLAFAKRMIETLRASAQSFDRIVFVQGLEGYDDVRPGSTAMAEWAGDAIADREIQTADFGLDTDEDALAVDDVAADSAAITEAVLAGEREGPVRDAVVLNAAVRLYAGGTVDSLDTGVERADAAIADGSAAERLAALEAFEP